MNMRKLSLVLAIIMLLTSMLSFAACDAGSVNEKDKNDKTEQNEDKETVAENESADPEEVSVADMVAAIEEKAPYGEYVDELLYKADDPDEMVCWTYGVVDINAYELLSDYVITMPSDYSHTLAILKFEDGMTDADFEEVKAVITDEYLETRVSALQMYMPEEFAIAEWAIENPDKIWRQYGDDLLVLAIYGEDEPTVVWDAIDAYLSGSAE